MLPPLTVASASEGHVHPPNVGEETDAPRAGGPDGGDDDDVLLAALEGVHGADLYLLSPASTEAFLPKGARRRAGGDGWGSSS